MSKTIFGTQHGPFVRIGVTYEEEERGSGLVVSLYRTAVNAVPVGTPQRFRFWNPAQVTKWFEKWSVANVARWQNAYHLSGLDGDSFRRPDGDTNDIRIEVESRSVPYHSQRDNERSPLGTCNVTSCAMALCFYNLPTLEHRYSQTEDNLSFWMAKKKLDHHDHGALETMMRAHGLDAEFKTGVSLDALASAVRTGVIAVVSGAFTKSGHIVCVIGMKNTDFIVHDPYGDYNSGYRDHSGSACIYSRATMQDVLVEKRKGRGPIWAHFIKGRLSE